MPTILITGASSGLGLGFLTHYAAQPTTSIYALDIHSLPPSLHSSQNITFHLADITDPAALAPIAQSFEEQNQHLDLLIHCAGIRGLVPSIAETTHHAASAERWPVIDKATFMRTLEINSWGGFHVLQTFLPALRRSSLISPKAVLLSSRMGSIKENSTGGGYAYRASKAALNALVRSFVQDVPDVCFLLLHPGRVETGLVGWREEGAVGVEECLGACLEVIAGAEGPDWSGRFVDRCAREIPW